jgi:disulfide bond formation protein DsbB
LILKFSLLFIAWIIVFVSVLGSLFFSEIMGFVPCSLCWYQRIFMYPLIFIIGVCLFPVDEKVVKFALPLVILGWFFAFYHNLLQWGILPESAAPCMLGVPCSANYINWMGFVTIPLLSLLAFTFIFISLILFYVKKTRI